MQFNLGLRPYEKVVYDRNLQALVDKIFPHFAQQVQINLKLCQTYVSSSIINHRIFLHLKDKLLEDQFYAACDKEDAASVNATGRPRLLPPPTNKRTLPNSESDHPSKKVSRAVNQSSSSSSISQPSSSSGAGAVKKAGSEEVVDGANPLTLRVAPLGPSLTSPGSPTALLTVLPALTRPLLRVTSKSVSVAKIQRFIHKRMGENVAFPPEDIEILRDGVVQSATALISRTDGLGGSSSETSTSTSSDSVINLQYRKIIRST